tara:strand:+ start:284 stop:538 length:255 start_codon:yes stop_codon:yes gene_type:complete
MRVIDSEHEMELAIEYTVDLVRDCEGQKDITFTFPSKGLSEIFLVNLASSLWYNKLAPVKGLNINVYIPDDEDFDEELEELDFN